MARGLVTESVISAVGPLNFYARLDVLFGLLNALSHLLKRAYLEHASLRNNMPINPTHQSLLAKIYQHYLCVYRLS